MNTQYIPVKKNLPKKTVEASLHSIIGNPSEMEADDVRYRLLRDLSKLPVFQNYRESHNFRRLIISGTGPIQAGIDIDALAQNLTSDSPIKIWRESCEKIIRLAENLPLLARAYEIALCKANGNSPDMADGFPELEAITELSLLALSIYLCKGTSEIQFLETGSPTGSTKHQAWQKRLKGRWTKTEALKEICSDLAPKDPLPLHHRIILVDENPGPDWQGIRSTKWSIYATYNPNLRSWLEREPNFHAKLNPGLNHFIIDPMETPERTREILVRLLQNHYDAILSLQAGKLLVQKPRIPKPEREPLDLPEEIDLFALQTRLKDIAFSHHSTTPLKRVDLLKFSPARKTIERIPLKDLLKNGEEKIETPLVAFVVELQWNAKDRLSLLIRSQDLQVWKLKSSASQAEESKEILFHGLNGNPTFWPA